MTNLLEEILFAAPDNLSDSTITITRELVRDRLDEVAKNSELSRYVL